MVDPPAPAMPTETSSNVPMDPEQMQYYLQYIYQRPISLRKMGETKYTCPYCSEVHDLKAEAVGHVPTVHCTKVTPGIVIGSRSFHSNYGVTVIEYETKADKSHWLRPLPNLPCFDLNLEITS